MLTEACEWTLCMEHVRTQRMGGLEKKVTRRFTAFDTAWLFSGIRTQRTARTTYVEGAPRARRPIFDDFSRCRCADGEGNRVRNWEWQKDLRDK